MTDNQKYIVSLFTRHPDFFLSCLFQYYPLSDELLSKYHRHIFWHDLSGNQNRKWKAGVIADFEQKWDWSKLAHNPSLPWTIEFLKAFPGRFKGYDLSCNPALPWSESFIFSYQKIWNVHYLVLNEGIPWTQDLIMHPYFLEQNWRYIHADGLWNHSFLIEHAEVLPWEWLCYNENIEWTEELIDELSPFWEDKERKTCQYTVSPWKGLSENPSVPWNKKMIEKYMPGSSRTFGLHWKSLSRNESLPWLEEELLKSYEGLWDWKILSTNNGIGFTEKLINEYEEKLVWQSGDSGWENIGSNQNLPWNAAFIAKYREKWNWCSISKNPGITWSEEWLALFYDKVNWHAISTNTNLPISIRFIQKFEQELFSHWFVGAPEQVYEMIWRKLLEPELNDEIVEQILYNQGNPFAMLKGYQPEELLYTKVQLSMEPMVRRILQIDYSIYYADSNLTETDAFLSSLQTELVKLLLVDEKALKLRLEKIKDIFSNSNTRTQRQLKLICEKVNVEITEFFMTQQIAGLAKDVAVRQKEISETRKEFAAMGGRISYDQSFLQHFIDNAGKRQLELAKLWVLTEEMIHWQMET